jgi:hypothetical protein
VGSHSGDPLHGVTGLFLFDMVVFPEDWQATIRAYQQRADENLEGLYLLREKVIPDDYYGWIHLFDAAEGIPN